MASYEELKPNKKGLPGIKIYVEHGYDEETGERIRFTKTVRMKKLSERAIKKAITEFEIEVANKQNVNKLENITFENFVKKWMDIYVKQNLSVRTRDTYYSYLQNGVLDYLGKMKMNKIKPFHIDLFYKDHKENGGKGLKGKHMMLKSIFSKAKKWKVISENPMDDVDIPFVEKRKREIQFYDEEQLKHLLQVLKKVYPKHALQIKLAALVGLRMKEIAGIRIENIDFENSTILIDKTLQYDKESKRFFLGPTKNKKSRIVEVPKKLMLEIKDYVDQLEKLKKQSGDAWKPMLDEDEKPVNLLFVKTNGFPSHPDSLTGRWREIVKRYNLPPLNLHGLRHTYASYALSKGTNFKVISEQLGHSDIKITLNIYSHLTKKDKERASDVFNDLLD